MPTHASSRLGFEWNRTVSLRGLYLPRGQEVSSLDRCVFKQRQFVLSRCPSPSHRRRRPIGTRTVTIDKEMARSCAISLPAAGRTLLLLLLGTAPPLASAFSPKMQYQARAWTPAKPTSLASVTLPGAGDVSPAPTEAPGRPDFGGVELFKRDFTKGTDTCGFAAQYKCASTTYFPIHSPGPNRARR